MKFYFNIGLMEVESYTVLENNIYDYIFWPPLCAFTHVKNVFTQEMFQVGEDDCLVIVLFNNLNSDP
jgi:hypothetical protein